LSLLLNEWLTEAARRTGTKPTQETIAAELGIGQSALSQRLRGKMAMSRDFAAAIAKLMNRKVSDFSPALAADIEHLSEGQAPSDPDEFAQVRRVDVSVSAGRGVLVVEEHSKSALTFRRSFLQEVGVTPNSAVIVSVKGHSMDPTLRDGAVLLVSTSAKTVVNGQIYAYRHDGELFVKRMHRTADGGLLAISDNPDREQFPDRKIEAYDQDFEIIGRALWMGSKL
jgi:phage repressor protein C with HTH and peptisase S24 domain